MLDPIVQTNSDDIAKWNLAPRADWSNMADTEHFVQFYEADGFLLNSLSGFIGAAITAGDGAVVVATEAHRGGLDELLSANGIDLASAKASGKYVALDATETLAKFMVDGSPDPARFNQVIGSVLASVSIGGAPVRAFGEMVALLWAEGNYNGAIRLEELWNDLQRSHTFSLFCAYPMNCLDRKQFTDSHAKVCTVHSRVIPAESYADIQNPDARLRAIAQLQQQAQSLTGEIQERQQVEIKLRNVMQELEVQVEDLRRLHEMSASLTRSMDVELVLREVLQSAMAVQGTDLGLLSLCDPTREGLNVSVSNGFEDSFLKKIEFVPAGGGACGVAYKERRRVVIEDTELDPSFVEYREAARDAGFRSVHSTPLISRRANVIGVLSVHFRQPHRPADRETRLLDLYARMAADVIENARLHQQVEQKLAEREQLLSRAEVARAEAETANRMKDEFLATVSHELRTPLNAIIGWSHLIKTGSLDKGTVARAVETIDRNAKSQAQLIEDILDVSRMITGKLRLNNSPVDITSVINAAIDSVQLAIDSKDIHLALTLDPSARHTLGDANRLQQVIWNLLANAIKFTPSGGHIEVKVQKAGGQLQIGVSDSGQGISPAFLPFIFDRFRQADGTTTRMHGGLGLGLSIVRHLVELHGGSIKAESAGEGRGATFTIWLPLASITERSQDRTQSSNIARKNSRAGQVSPMPSLNEVKVLLVDDDHDTLQILSMMLSETKATVQTAASVSEALEIVEWFKPDVLVSDLAMPGEDGYSLIGKLRALESTRQTGPIETRQTGSLKRKQTGDLSGKYAAGEKKGIPAVALTSYVRVEDRARALSAGFNMFVPKPVQPDELITAIANLAEGPVN